MASSAVPEWWWVDTIGFYVSVVGVTMVAMVTWMLCRKGPKRVRTWNAVGSAAWCLALALILFVFYIDILAKAIAFVVLAVFGTVALPFFNSLFEPSGSDGEGPD